MRLARELLVHWNFFSKRFTTMQGIEEYRLAERPEEDVAAHRLFLICHVAMWTVATHAILLLAWFFARQEHVLLAWILADSLVLVDAMACFHVYADVRQEREHEAKTWEKKLVRDVLGS